MQSKKGFVCPDCGEVIEMPLVDEGAPPILFMPTARSFYEKIPKTIFAGTAGPFMGSAL